MSAGWNRRGSRRHQLCSRLSNHPARRADHVFLDRPHKLQGLPPQLSTRKTRNDMRARCSSIILARFCALIVFASYLMTGASLALPSEMRCARCFKIGQVGAVKPGMSCPLSYNGQHCHHGHSKTSGKITLCPDGCLRHDGEGGEIPSLAKFLSPPASLIPARLLTGATLAEQLHVIEDPFLSPLDHPPPSLRS